MFLLLFMLMAGRLKAFLNIRTHHECEGGIEKYILRIVDWHHEACRVMTKGDHEGRIFLTHPHTNNVLFYLVTAKYLILYWKSMKKDFQKILKSLKCDMVTSFIHYNDVTDRRATSVRPTCGCSFSLSFL